MSDDGKNKVDSIIDEVLESRRLRQATRFLFKSVFGLIIIGILIFIFAIAAGVIR